MDYKLVLLTGVFGSSISCHPLLLYGQHCNQKLIPDSSSVQGIYQARTGDKRCEGLIVKEVSGTTRPFTINSVMIGRLAYELTSDEVLKIKAPQTKRFKQILVTGASFNHNKNYRLDMLLNAGEQKKVPVNDVIGAYSFKPEQLRFYYLFPGEENHFLPAIITSEYYDSVIEDSLLNISIVCGMNIKNVVIRYSIVNQDGFCGSAIEPERSLGNFLRRKEIKLQVNLNQLEGIKSNDVDLCFSVNAKDGSTGNDLPAYQFKVFISKRK